MTANYLRSASRLRKNLLGLVFCLLWALTACDGVYSGTLIFEGQHRFDGTTRLPGDVFLRAGTAEFATGSRVDGSVYVVGGRLRLNGELGGDLVVLDGVVDLGPQAVVGGDLRLGGGRVVRVETAVVAGEVVEGVDAQLPLDAPAEARGVDDYVRTLTAILLLAGLGYWMRRRAETVVGNVSNAATDYPLVSGALGLLAALVLPALLVVMAFTIILIPLVVVIGIVLLLLVGCGLVALGAWLGDQIARRLPWEWSPAQATFGGTLLLALSFEVPVVGDIVLAVAAIWSFGAVLLTRFGLRPYRPPAYLQASDAPSTYARPVQDPEG